MTVTPDATRPETPRPEPHPAPGAGFRWALFGCMGLAVLLIVAMVWAGLKARTMLGWALGKIGDQVEALAVPPATPGEVAAFRASLVPFVARAKSGEVSPAEVRAFQQRAARAVEDGRVTPEEIRDLTNLLKGAGPPGK